MYNLIITSTYRHILVYLLPQDGLSYTKYVAAGKQLGTVTSWAWYQNKQNMKIIPPLNKMVKYPQHHQSDARYIQLSSFYFTLWSNKLNDLTPLGHKNKCGPITSLPKKHDYDLK